LPPVRAPGPQSQRESRGAHPLWTLFTVAVTVVLARVFAAEFFGLDGAAAWAAAAGVGVLAAVPTRRRHGRLRAAKGIELRLDTPEVARGGEVLATVTLPDAGAVRRLEVGLVCTERYDVKDRSGDRTTRETRRHVEYEAWRQAQPGLMQQTVRLTVPAHAPYSHEGTVLSFLWTVTVVERRDRRPDRHTDAPLWVKP
jgi:hypothetical protein